jgi:uncharacterized protein YndB with AHSA1/START domain
MSEPAAAEQILITRIFDAPRAEVFRAWTDPEEVARWFGPEHFDTPRDRVRIDLRVGGRYELTMVQRDSGAEFAVGYEIVALSEPELLVLRRQDAHDAQRRPVPGRDGARRGRLDRRLRQAGGTLRRLERSGAGIEPTNDRATAACRF